MEYLNRPKQNKPWSGIKIAAGGAVFATGIVLFLFVVEFVL